MDRYYSMYETTTIGILTSLVNMSVKYDFREIRSEIIQHLAQYFPDKLEVVKQEKPKELFSDHSESPNNSFQLLTLARILDAPIFAPHNILLLLAEALGVIFNLSKAASVTLADLGNHR